MILWVLFPGRKMGEKEEKEEAMEAGQGTGLSDVF